MACKATPLSTLLHQIFVVSVDQVAIGELSVTNTEAPDDLRSIWTPETQREVRL